MKKKIDNQNTDEKRKDDPEQSQRFIETARELGADENSNLFEKIFKKIFTNK